MSHRKSFQALLRSLHPMGFLLGLAVLIVPFALCGATHKLWVGDPAEAASLLTEGGRLIADYGSFQVIEAEGSGQTRSVQFRDDFHIIELNARRLDTRSTELRALPRGRGAFPGKRLYLVQFAGPVKPAWADEVKLCGAHIVSYIPQNAYLIYGDADILGRVQFWADTNAVVQWDGDYADDYKIHPKAKPSKGTNQAQTDLFAIQLVDDPPANSATMALIDRLKLAPVQRKFSLLHKSLRRRG